MPTHNQNTVDTPEGGNGKLGGVKELSRSNTASLKKSFPGSPIHSGQMTRESVQSHFQDNVLDGIVENGYCFSSFNRDYSGAPNITGEVEGGPEGLPGSAHMPNPVAATQPGVISPGSMGAPPEDLESSKTSRPPFIGAGSALDPSSSSERQSQHKIKDYVMGKSHKDSIGSYTSSK